jgi:hypothetical protein
MNEQEIKAHLDKMAAERQARRDAAWDPFLAKWEREILREVRDAGESSTAADLSSLCQLLAKQAAHRAGRDDFETRWGLIAFRKVGMAILFNNHLYKKEVGGHDLRDQETNRFRRRLAEGIGAADDRVTELAYAESVEPGEKRGYSFALLLEMREWDYDAVFTAYQEVRGETFKKLLVAK